MYITNNMSNRKVFKEGYDGKKVPKESMRADQGDITNLLQKRLNKYDFQLLLVSVLACYSTYVDVNISLDFPTS